jgi:GNAT superfamily N-acetyltransferase
VLVSTRTTHLPERQARLKDGRALTVRHGRAGDELGIAYLVAHAFWVYPRAAHGDLARAARSYAREVRPEEFVVAELTAGGRLVGASCVSEHGAKGSNAAAGLLTKLACWGLYGALCFLLEKLRRRLLESRHRTAPGELYRYLDAVDESCRSLGVGRYVADFVDDYARASGHHTVLAKHHADNRPVVALHQKRGCALVELPAPPLARLLRRPGMVLSRRTFDATRSRGAS